jgi:cytochrome P450
MNFSRSAPAPLDQADGLRRLFARNPIRVIPVVSNPHMAFGGGGPHLCLGLHVARIEIQAMLREVLTRLPGLRANGTPEPMASNFMAFPSGDR